MSTQTPVTIIGGFLGSGKTTLLNQVLYGNRGVRYAVLVNDFGDLAIDEALIRKHDGDTISFANGCVCCSLGDNLVATINGLLDADNPPEHFLIEVSGVANPKTLADVATLHPRLRRDLIITLVDASVIQTRLQDDRLADTVIMQLRPADLVVINKCDLSDHATVEKTEGWMAANIGCRTIRTVNAQLPAGVLSDQELTIATPHITRSVDAKTGTSALQQVAVHHRPEEQFFRATLALEDELEIAKLQQLLMAHRETLVRAKGFMRRQGLGSELLSIQFSGKRVDIQPCYPHTQPHFNPHSDPHSDPENAPLHNLENTEKTGLGEMASVLVVIGLKPLDLFTAELQAINGIAQQDRQPRNCDVA